MLLSKNNSSTDSRQSALPASITRFPSVNGANGNHDRIAFTVGYMQEFLSEPLQVPALARLANLSPSHFFAVFKKRTGFAPKDFFIRLKIQRACDILQATDLCVKEVAAKLGYEDPFYFSRLFKSVNGVAPTDYRRLDQSRRTTLRNAALPIQNGVADSKNGITNDFTNGWPMEGRSVVVNNR